jgi:hypothetical protein
MKETNKEAERRYRYVSGGSASSGPERGSCVCMCHKTGVGETDGSFQKPEPEVGEPFNIYGPVIWSDHVDNGARCRIRLDNLLCLGITEFSDFVHRTVF